MDLSDTVFWCGVCLFELFILDEGSQTVFWYRLLKPIAEKGLLDGDFRKELLRKSFCYGTIFSSATVVCSQSIRFANQAASPIIQSREKEKGGDAFEGVLWDMT